MRTQDTGRRRSKCPFLGGCSEAVADCANEPCSLWRPAASAMPMHTHTLAVCPLVRH